MKTTVCVIALCLAGLVSCSSSSSGTGAPSGHSLQLDVTLNADSSGQLAFLTPSNTIVKYPASQFVGKPYLIGTFHAGFAQGNDPPIDHTWSTIPADMKVHYETPATYADGPYDIVFVLYAATPITPAIESGPAQSAPAAKAGDLASFSLDTSPVHAGDPKNPLGTLRLNVAGGNASVAIENRTPQDPSNGAQTTAAFANTVLAVP